MLFFLHTITQQMCVRVCLLLKRSTIRYATEERLFDFQSQSFFFVFIQKREKKMEPHSFSFIFVSAQFVWLLIEIIKLVSAQIKERTSNTLAFWLIVCSFVSHFSTLNVLVSQIGC